MEELPVFTLSNLSGVIQRIQSNIDQINAATEQIIRAFEQKKSELRNSADPNLEKVEAVIQDVNLEHDRLVQKLLSQKTDVSLRKQSVDRLDRTIAELDQEISRIQSKRDQKIEELERQKSYIMRRLRSVQNLHMTVRDIATQIDETSRNFGDDMAEADEQKFKIEQDASLSESQRALALEVLEHEVKEKKHVHDDYLASLERQRDESLLKVQALDTGDSFHMKSGDELETGELAATPSQLGEINTKAKQKGESSALINLNKQGLTLSPSGDHLVTTSGRILTLAEAQKSGLLDGTDVTHWPAQEQLEGDNFTSISRAQRDFLQGIDALQQQQQRGEVSSAPTTTSHLSEEMREGLDGEDVGYLKEVFGTPLTLALAEICAKQPRDPIHYLGHWLYKYRYNQEVDEARKNEISLLVAERQRIAQEARHKEAEGVVQEAVLEMAFKAHQEVLRKENVSLQRDIVETETEEFAEEARDVVGELGRKL